MFVQNHPRDLKQRIGAAVHLDLPGERFDAIFIGRESDVDVRQRRGSGGTFGAAVIAARASVCAAEFSTATIKARTAKRTLAPRRTALRAG